VLGIIISNHLGYKEKSQRVAVWCFNAHPYFHAFCPAKFDGEHGEFRLGSVDIMCLKAITTLAVFLATIPVAAPAEEITVGSCPSNIVVERLGEWAALSNDVETVEILRSNPNRTNKVAAAYVADDASMLEVVVLSLRSLERFQGGISESDFNALRAEFAKAFQGHSPEMQAKIDKVIEGNLSGTGSSGSHLRYEPTISSPGKLIGFALTEFNIPGLGTTIFETAMKMQHIRGCIVQANFSIAVSPGSRDRLDQAISDFVMR
jgi:hypothetical protein